MSREADEIPLNYWDMIVEMMLHACISTDTVLDDNHITIQSLQSYQCNTITSICTDTILNDNPERPMSLFPGRVNLASDLWFLSQMDGIWQMVSIWGYCMIWVRIELKQLEDIDGQSNSWLYGLDSTVPKVLIFTSNLFLKEAFLTSLAGEALLTLVLEANTILWRNKVGACVFNYRKFKCFLWKERSFFFSYCLLDSWKGSSLEVEILSVCPFVCPSSLLIISLF